MLSRLVLYRPRKGLAVYRSRKGLERPTRYVIENRHRRRADLHFAIPNELPSHHPPYTGRAMHGRQHLRVPFPEQTNIMSPHRAPSVFNRCSYSIAISTLDPLAAMPSLTRFLQQTNRSATHKILLNRPLRMHILPRARRSLLC